MQKRLAVFLSLVVVATGSVFYASGLPGQGAAATATQPAEASFAESLKQIFALREKIRDIHPALVNLYPVAVAQDGKLLIFSPDESRKEFVLSKTAPQPFPFPKGIRAAFPLEALGGKPACVVTPEVFDAPDGLVVVLHEFVHCTQWATCEMKLKEQLGVYRKAVEKKDFQWELQHPFPYADPAFEAAYGRMLAALAAGDEAAVRKARAELRRTLGSDDLEYMLWQEWKEGLARFLENRIRARLGHRENRGGVTPPFSRVTFYAGGDQLIAWINRSDPAAVADFEKTFQAIASR